jgi:hypothetical protein
LKCHKMDLFHDGEWTKSLVVQFLQRLKCFHVLSSKLCLVSNLENLLVSVMFINIFLVMFLCLPKVGYKLCSNVHQPHVLIFNWLRMLFTPWMPNLKCKPWFAKKKSLLCWKMDYVIVSSNFTMDKRYNQLWNVSIVPSFDWPVLFVHLSRGGKLIITSLSHLIVQKMFSKTWMQTRVYGQKWYFQEGHDIEKHDKKLTWLSFHWFLFCYKE